MLEQWRDRRVHNQQNNGDNNAINSATALDGVAGNAQEVDQYANATALSGRQYGYEYSQNGPVADHNNLRGNLVENTLNDAGDVFTVQQNNGNGNGMPSSTAAAGVTRNAASVSQFATAQSNSLYNDTYNANDGGERANLIENGFNRAKGVSCALADFDSQSYIQGVCIAFTLLRLNNPMTPSSIGSGSRRMEASRIVTSTLLQSPAACNRSSAHCHRVCSGEKGNSCSTLGALPVET